VARSGRRARFSMSCGPAREVQDFVKETPWPMKRISCCWTSTRNLGYVRDQINRAKNQFSQQTRIETRRVSVHHLLRQNAHQEHFGPGPGFDLIYCGRPV